MANLPFSDKYKEAKYMNPGDNISPAKKLKKDPDGNEDSWVLRKMQYMYSSYLRGDAYIPSSSVDEIQINRLYAQGRQPIQKYRELLTTKTKEGEARKGWMNMSWDIFPILPKFRSIPIGQFDGTDFVTNVYANDSYSNEKRDDIKLDMLIEQKYGKQHQELRQAIGIEQEKESLPIQPQNKEEINMIFDMGFKKMEEEVEMDTFCIATEQRCGWNEIKKRLIEDFVDIGIGAVKDYNDPVNHKPMVRYVDPQYLIVRQTRANDFYNVTEAGEICWYSVSDLKMYGFTDDQIWKCIQSYDGQFGNKYFNSSDNYNNNLDKFNDYRVAVLDGEFQSADRMFFETRRDGVVTEMPFGSEASSRKNKVSTKEYQKLYRAKWVIGTDIIFDDGLQYDANYSPEGTPKSSFTVYRAAERSMISQCIAVADDIQLTILKKRNAITNAAPPGLKIEWGSLSGMADASGKKITPFEILRIYRESGDLLYKAAISEAGTIIQGAQSPVDILPGGLGTFVSELMSDLQFSINMLREITGINASADASTPANGALVGTSNLAMEATMKVLKPILSAYQNVKQRAFNNIVTRWQIAQELYDMDEDTMSVDNTLTKVKLRPGVYHLGFQAYCDQLVTQQEKAELQAACLASMQAAKTGSVGITMADYLICKQFIARGNLRAAWIFLAYKEQERQAQAQAIAMQNQQANNEAQAQTAQMTNEGMMAAAQKTQETELLKITEKGKQERLSIQMKYVYELQLQKNELATDVKIAKEKPKTQSA